MTIFYFLIVSEIIKKGEDRIMIDEIFFIYYNILIEWKDYDLVYNSIFSSNNIIKMKK